MDNRDAKITTATDDEVSPFANMEPPQVVAPAEQGQQEPEQQEREKPDYVKKIESFDINNITPENVEFMVGVIQDYFRENFPVAPELIDQLSGRYSVLSRDEYMATYDPDSESSFLSFSDSTGYYNEHTKLITINGAKASCPGELFATMFHEGLHYVSINSGAGLIGTFTCPDDMYEQEESRRHMNMGMHALEEGTTQQITLWSVVDDMGFTPHDGMYGYPAECLVADAVWAPFPRSVLGKVYFKTPFEKLREYVERIADERKDIPEGENVVNGVFSECLANLGVVTEKMKEAFKHWGSPDFYEKRDAILNDIHRAIGYFIFREQEKGAITIDDDYKEYLDEYMKPLETAKEQE